MSIMKIVILHDLLSKIVRKFMANNIKKKGHVLKIFLNSQKLKEFNSSIWKKLFSPMKTAVIFVLLPKKSLNNFLPNVVNQLENIQMEQLTKFSQKDIA